MAPRLLLLLMAGAAVLVPRADATGIVYTLLRNNVAGTPENFQTTRWDFNPQAASTWSKEYRRLHGIRGEELIERLGLGEDERTEERRRAQHERDRGVYVSRQMPREP